MKFEFERHRIDKQSKEEILSLLMKAAEQFSYQEFGKRDLNAARVGISSSGVQNAFGSWSAAISALREKLHEKGLTLQSRSRMSLTDEALFHEMHGVWSQLDHRPSKHEWEAASPKHHYNTYRRRFGGWSNACLKFLEWRMGGVVEIADSSSEPDTPSTNAPKSANGGNRRRDPPPRLRLRILDRDGYRCVLSGRSPAMQRGVLLHLDHIIPFADGGATTFENLRTLCQDCNLGRGRMVELGEPGV